MATKDCLNNIKSFLTKGAMTKGKWKRYAKRKYHEDESKMVRLFVNHDDKMIVITIDDEVEQVNPLTPELEKKFERIGIKMNRKRKTKDDDVNIFNGLI